MELIDGGVDLFDALVYGKPHPGTQNFIQTQMEQLSANMTDYGQQFYQSVQALYDRVGGSTAMRYAHAAKRAMGAVWQSNEIRPLTTMGEMQQAPPVMQRYIMANPTLRKWWQQQRIEGYADSYVDTDPGTLGEDHYDYRRVMNGVVVIDEETGDWSATTYFDELLPEDEELLFEEQQDIIDSWEHFKAAIKQGRSDPTSRWNADL